MPLVLELQCDIPYEFYPGRCDGFEEYMTLKEQICYDYRHPPDFKRLYAEGQCSVRENFPGRLKYGLRVDDGPLMLEHCLRYVRHSVFTLLITDIPAQNDFRTQSSHHNRRLVQPAVCF